MRKLAALVLCCTLLIWFWCSGPSPIEVDPFAMPDVNTNYTVVYWEREVPPVMDPKGIFKSGVQGLVDEFVTEHPHIKVELRWLPWIEGEDLLKDALRDGEPPDIFGDWLGLARRDHVLQMPVGVWLDETELKLAGKRSVVHDGDLWAWPRWVWPGGFLALKENLELPPQTLEEIIYRGWSWYEFSEWVTQGNVHLMVNDWNGEFTGQMLMSATGQGFGAWGGQELIDVLIKLEELARSGKINPGGEYRKISTGKNMVGGSAPAFATWLVGASDEPVILPLPGMHKQAAYVPVSSANLVQFRQVKYKGDDHSAAAASFARFMAKAQAEAFAETLMAAPVWTDLDWGGNLPSAIYSMLADTASRGMPLSRVDRIGRAREDSLRRDVGGIMEDLWLGKADAHEIAQRLEGLR